MIVAVTGLNREARIIARPDIITVVGGGDRDALKTKILTALDAGAGRILSVGICGALTRSLRVGDCIIATGIVAGDVRLATDIPWTSELLKRVPGAKAEILTGTDAIVANREAKSRLHQATNAAAVDMESHIAVKVAEEQGLPFAAVRVVSDSWRQSLPPAALVAMSKDSGRVDLPAVLRSLLAKPGQIPSLVRTAWEAEKAFRALFRYRHVLNPFPEVGLVPADVSELSLDVS